MSIQQNGNGHIKHATSENGFKLKDGLKNGNGVAPTAAQDKNSKDFEFLKQVFDLTLEEGYRQVKNREVPVINFKNPTELRELIDFNLRDQPEDNEKLLDHCKDVFRYSVKTGHPRFFNQLYAGLDPHGFAGSVITDVLNPSIYTYEVSPVFVLMEMAILQKFCEMVGFANGDGTFCPGGSYSNMLGLNLARYRKFPDVKEVGLSALPKMVAFCSKHCHYSNKKNAALLGLGTNNMVGVEVNETGEMDIDDLKRKVDIALQEGSVPFCVIGTSGTTVMGAYDNLNAIADVCQEYSMWLHTDACWGGGALFSKKLKSRMAGIERSDSVAMNPHKLLSAPQQCCMFVTQHPEVLNGSSSLHVPYLFQNDKKSYDAKTYDIGRKVIQCGRRVDALKLWMMWKAQGNSGLEARVNKSFANARYLADLVKQRPGFHLLQEPTCTNVCFYYVPERLRDVKFDLSDTEFSQEINAIPPVIKGKMTERGSMMTGYQPIDDKPNFFRMIVISEDVTFQDMEFVIDEIDSIGKKL